jgi:hypothetical protein
MGAQESAREAYKLIERTSEGVFFMGGEHRKRELVSSNLSEISLWKTIFFVTKRQLDDTLTGCPGNV